MRSTSSTTNSNRTRAASRQADGARLLQRTARSSSYTGTPVSVRHSNRRAAYVPDRIYGRPPSSGQSRSQLLRPFHRPLGGRLAGGGTVSFNEKFWMDRISRQAPTRNTPAIVDQCDKTHRAAFRRSPAYGSVGIEPTAFRPWLGFDAAPRLETRRMRRISIGS